LATAAVAGALVGGVAGAAPAITLVPAAPSVCTWQGGDGSTPSSWADGNNWTTTYSGTSGSCTSAGGPAAGSIVVFPAGASTKAVTYDTGVSAFDAMEFDASYTVSGSGTITLTPLGTTSPQENTSCGATVGICATSGSTTFAPGLSVGAPQEFAAGNGATFQLNGALSGSSPLSVDDATYGGTITLTQDDSAFSGGVTVGGGTSSGGGLAITNGNALGSATTTIDHGGWLWVGASGSNLTVPNTVVLGDNQSGIAWLIDRGADDWTGTVELNHTTTPYVAATTGNSSQTFTISGDIVDDGTGTPPPLELNGTVSSTFSGDIEIAGPDNTYDGGTIVDPQAVQVDAGSTLGTGTVTVNSGAVGPYPWAILAGDGTVPAVNSNGMLLPLGTSRVFVAGARQSAVSQALANPRALGEGPGILTATGNVDLNVGGTPGGGAFAAFLYGTSPGSGPNGYSQLQVSPGKQVNLHYAALLLADDYQQTGASYTVISAPGGVSGEFYDLCTDSPIPPGGTTHASIYGCGSRTYRVTYTLTSVVLTDVTGSSSGGGGGGGGSQGCPSGATCNSASTPTGANPAIASEGGVTATASGGVGSVQVGAYSTNPAGPPTFGSTGRYFDVRLSSPNTFTQVTVQDCDLNGGTSLEWWNPSAVGGAGAWQLVVGDPGPTYSAGPPACVSVTLDSTTSPSLADLTGTVFAVSNGATAGASAANGAPEGYWLAGSDGGVFAFGDAGYYGSVPGVGVHINDVVGMSPTADRAGYWLAGSDGGVFSFGDAGFHGSVPGAIGHAPASPVVGMAATPDGGGYWLVGADGGVYAFGDAGFHGSVPGAIGHAPASPVVGMAATPDGGGYWLTGADGGVYAFGDAGFHGSVPGAIGHAPASPVVGIAPSPDGLGYWLTGTDGGVYAFGDAGFHGSVPGAIGHAPASPVVGIAPSPDGLGYWLTGTDGGVYSFGDAGFEGSVPGAGAHVNDVRGIAAT
jgi:hypothetical protein